MMTSSKLEARIIKLVNAVVNKEELAEPLVRVINSEHQIASSTYEKVSTHPIGRWNKRIKVLKSACFKSILKKLEPIIKEPY